MQKKLGRRGATCLRSYSLFRKGVEAQIWRRLNEISESRNRTEACRAPAHIWYRMAGVGYADSRRRNTASSLAKPGRGSAKSLEMSHWRPNGPLFILLLEPPYAPSLIPQSVSIVGRQLALFLPHFSSLLTRPERDQPLKVLPKRDPPSPSPFAS